MSKKRLSDVVQGVVDRLLAGERIDARTAAVDAWDDIDLDGQYLAGIEGLTRRIKEAAVRTRATALQRHAEGQQAELPFSLPGAVPMDIEGRCIRLTRDLSRPEFMRAISVREDQIKADQAAVREWKKALSAADRFWLDHPGWSFGECLDAIMSEPASA